jgi:hypothetical protein
MKMDETTTWTAEAKAGHDSLEFWHGGPGLRLARALDQAAQTAVEGLLVAKTVVGDVCPGDMTAYRFMLAWAIPTDDMAQDYEGRWRRRLYAALLNCGGSGGYEVGAGWISPSYASEKWLGGGGRGYTDFVVARFLNLVAAGLADECAAERREVDAIVDAEFGPGGGR